MLRVLRADHEGRNVGASDRQITRTRPDPTRPGLDEVR